MKKILLISAFAFLFGIAACSSELSDKEAVQLATDKYFNKQLKELRAYAPQATRASLGLRVQSSEALSNDGIHAKIKLTVKGIDAPRRGHFPEPYSVVIEITKSE